MVKNIKNPISIVVLRVVSTKSGLKINSRSVFTGNKGKIMKISQRRRSPKKTDSVTAVINISLEISTIYYCYVRNAPDRNKVLASVRITLILVKYLIKGNKIFFWAPRYETL